MDKAPLKKRRLGHSGVELSQVTVGTWGLCAGAYGDVFPEQRAHTLARALESGVTSFDMAPVWGEDGGAERAVAEAVGDKRDQCAYVTRVGLTPGGYGYQRAFGADALRQQCEQSLERLRTDRIDVLLLHNPSSEELRNDEVVGAMESLCSQGKARTWGASVSNVDDARSALEVGAQVLCVPHSLLTPHLLWDIENDCRARAVPVMVRSVLLYGVLCGRYSQQRRFGQVDHRSRRWSPEAFEERVKQVHGLRDFAGEPTSTLTSLALRFAVSSDFVASAVVGPRTPGQVDSAIAAFDGATDTLPAELLTRVKAHVRAL